MRRLSFVLLAILLAAPARAQQGTSVSRTAGDAAHQPGRHLRFVLADHVVEELGALVDELRRETVRCLIGVVRGDSAVVDLAWRPPIDASTPTHVQYWSCPAATLALWHNHVWTVEPAPEYACYLSATDIDEALRPHGPPIQIVQVTSEVACWWTRSEVAQAAGAVLLFPRPDHQWGRPVTLSASTCRGELRDMPACTLLRMCEGPGSDRRSNGSADGAHRGEGRSFTCPAPLALAGAGSGH
jgi:hypothetical protein